MGSAINGSGPIIEPVTSEIPKNINTKADSAKVFKIATIVLAVLVVIESIAIGFMMMNHVGLSRESDFDTEDEEESSIEEDTEEIDDTKYVFNDDGDLTAFDLTCTQENGASYIFSKDGSFSYNDASGDMSSGSYSFVHNGIISLTGGQDNNRVLYYDGSMVADGTTIYECEIQTQTQNQTIIDLEIES